MAVALVVGVDHHRHIAEHGLGSGGGDGQAALHVSADHLRSLGEGVADMPQEAVFFFALYLQVTDCGLEHRVPVHQSLAAVDQALFIQANKGFGDDAREFVVHREVFAGPVDAVAHASHLGRDGVAALFLPFPYPGDEVLARLQRRCAHGVAADSLRLQLALDDDLGRDAGVVGARNPDRIEAAHPVVTRQAVHDGLVERVAHVQCSGHVGRRQLDCEGRRPRSGNASSAVARLRVAAALPFGAPMRFDRARLKGLGQAFKPGLLRRCVHGNVGVNKEGRKP